jgi:aminoglycoside phosphotransferase (APT) family kinase protein
MDKIKRTKVLRTNLLEHPSVTAWNRLRPECVDPNRIVILRETKSSEASVYRIDGVGLRGSAVIAKYNRTEIASIERTIYEGVLPHLPIPSLHYYGYIEEDSQFCWLFLEYAVGEIYSPLNEEHRALAARWVGLLHTSTALIPPSVRLPDRGPGHYLDHLKCARDRIQRNLGNPALCVDDLEVLESIILQCDILEQRWSQVEKFCDGMPRTITHGDLKEKNVHVRNDQQGTVLIAFDWETAGWGVPAIDLRKVDVIEYWRTVRNQWLDMDFQTIQRLTNLGKMFWCLAAINWEALSLAYEWIERPMEMMRLYQARLSDAIQAFEDAN